MKIVLLGYMGCGKTRVGKLLETLLPNIKLIDLDVHICQQENMSITELFKTKGEIYFREREHFYLKKLLTDDRNLILSLGGGTPCFYDNMNLINTQTSYSFYINLSVKTLVERLIPKKHTRPLIKDIPDEELHTFIAKHIFERNNFYKKAHYTIQGKDMTSKKVADFIKKKVCPSSKKPE